MSYRASSYRKVQRIVRKTISTASGESAKLPRHEMNRILHWSRQAALPKPSGWGKPKAAR
ncbi:hypothetical protein [Streptomyces cinereoruber]|uniref:hypothetical protein n=1 Tax=Streptomyces cinereoruber TaxID=67260 RepID=UPI003C2B137B